MSDVDTEPPDDRGWTILSGDVPAYPLALQMRLSAYAELDAHGPCLGMRSLTAHPEIRPVLFTCNRGGRHLGRHLATADQGTGAPIVAAWPGTHTPVLTDMIGQPDLIGGN